MTYTKPRTTCDWSSEPIDPTTYDRLIAALEEKYPGKVRRAVCVMPGAVEKVIDNEADALETIRRCQRKDSE